MQPYPLRLLGCAGAALLLACGDERERSIIRADAEIFDSVVQTQRADTLRLLPRTLSVRIDSRPVGDNADLAATPDRPRQLDLSAAEDSLSAAALEAVVQQRKRILRSAGIEEGGPFNYPECGGARMPRSADSTNYSPAAVCPDFVRRYITVGLPFRGAAQILNRARPVGAPPPDSTGEMWTVLMTESSVGPGGQQWRQYVSLFRRDAGSGRLGLVERFLLSWAE